MRKQFRGWILAGILGFAVPLACQDVSAAASEFAARIANRITPAAASLTIKNNSSLPVAAISLVESQLREQLRARGWRLDQAGESGNSIEVALSENLGHYVWTAQIGVGDKTEAVVFEVPHTHDDESPSRVISLSRTLLIGSDLPLLDIALLKGKTTEGAHLLALTPAAVQLYQFQSATWHLLQTQALTVLPVPNRDLRGRIVADQGSAFDAYLPGVHCTGIVTSGLSFSCRATDDPWPLSDDRHRLGFYVASRNFFNGVISIPGAQGENAGPFYSAAILNDRVLYSGIDGKVRMQLAGQHAPQAISPQWGSSIAGIQSSCQTDLVLASASADFDSSDQVTAFRAGKSDFVPASEALSFSGPVLGMKASIDRQQAVAIVSSLSGRYEGYLLTARCGA
ncbi:MAG: hypothetical protein JOZ10_16525 [Acidobacteria bacterium]|nr:hypothetical protein [Acidobacteriota bacterium]MBV9144561.1 hypothetical protein [Acidobacteriota bacterium]MBV9437903.1 hypothetical protein [Acidobacteriota bacterium]